MSYESIDYLTERIDLLEQTKIKKYINKINRPSLEQIFIFDNLASTNDYLLQYAKQHADTNVVCLAEQQTAGRGRLGRTWVSPFGVNIYLSLLWHFKCDISQLSGLNVVVGVSVAEAIHSIVPSANIKLKWPNDIYWQNKKLGGILIDILAEYNGGCAAVIGIGLNVNMSQVSGDKINQPWTDLQTATNSTISRNKLTGIALDSLITNLQIFQQDGVSDFIKKWNKLDYLSGKKVTVQSIRESINGIVQGTNEQGHLILANDNGKPILISSGDVQLL